MANRLFNQVMTRKPKRNVFDLSHEVKMSTRMGKLVPILCEPVVPGDTFKVRSEIMMRFAPMLAPIMHRVNVYTHYFFVPNRIVWNEWETFITGGPDGTSNPVYPRFQLNAAGSINNGNLFDYLGFPAGQSLGTNYSFDALPFRAYQLIYNEYYRDQNLETAVTIPLTSGTTSVTPASINTDGYNIMKLRYRAWEKDYFTSALPWVQRGADVRIPLSGSAPVKLGLGTPSEMTPMAAVPAGGWQTATISAQNDTGNATTNMSIKADLANATASTINELRRGIRLQEWLEKNARGGARYIEQILSHFGVMSSDARLQRPEYLGGGKTPVVISEVLQTSQTDTTPQATMAGHGISVGSTNEFKKFFEEHGYVIGIMSVIPRTAYQNGTPRKYLKFDKFDHYFPEFANLGEQPIYNNEIYSQGTADDNGTFGYQSRYAEYKYCPSRVCGDFRSNLDFWHLGRKFATKPVLNKDFVSTEAAATTLNRIFAVTQQTTDNLWVQIYHDFQAIRPMPKFGTPTI